MQSLLKITVAVVFFMIVLFVNVSANPNKGAVDLTLSSFKSEANAGCEWDPNNMNNTGVCSALGYCFWSVDANQCNPALIF